MRYRSGLSWNIKEKENAYPKQSYDSIENVEIRKKNLKPSIQIIM